MRELDRDSPRVGRGPSKQRACVSQPVPPIGLLTNSAPGGVRDALIRAQRAVSAKAGIIRRVYYEPLYADDPNVYWAVSEPSKLEGMIGRAVANMGIATASTPERAAIKAIVHGWARR